MSSESETMCAICHQDATEDPDFTALLCGHSFHQVCIGTYADSMRVLVADLKCPTCKRTSADMEQAEYDLDVADVASSSHAVPDANAVPVVAAVESELPAEVAIPDNDRVPVVVEASLPNDAPAPVVAAVPEAVTFKFPHHGTYFCSLCHNVLEESKVKMVNKGRSVYSRVAYRG